MVLSANTAIKSRSLQLHTQNELQSSFLRVPTSHERRRAMEAGKAKAARIEREQQMRKDEGRVKRAVPPPPPPGDTRLQAPELDG